MKTKFFKKLSFVLVVAMVLSLFVPATSAFAAAGPKLNSTKKYLHLGRVDSGENEFNFNINNKKSGWKYFWESANEAVAEVNEKNGVTTATGVGKTKVTVTITDKDGEEVTTLSATVTVRDNIKEVTISNPVEKLAVGEEHDYNRSFKTESGSTKKTSSITRWTVEPADKATIDEKGVFVATEAGEYKVTALSFQSKARYNAWEKDPVANAGEVLDTDETTVLVAGSMVSAKQKNLNTVNVTFDSAMADVDKNIAVYQIVGTTKVKQLIKEVKMDDDKKVASVTLYIDFAKGSTFQIEYPDMDAVSFVAATTNAEDVASMVIDTTTAVKNVEKEVKVKLFNAEGVEITTPTLLTRITMKSAGEQGTFFNTSTKKVLIFEVGKTTQITATYHTYKYDNAGNPIGNVEAVGTVIGIEADSTNITGLNAWTIMLPADGPNFNDVKQQLAADDYGKRLYVKLNNKTGNDTGSVNSDANSGDFDFTSSDESILIVGSNGSLYPVKEGVVTVVVKYATSGTKVPVATVTITVSAKKAATNFTLDAYEFALSNSVGLGDSKQVTMQMKDQLGRAFAYTGYKIERLSAPYLSDGVTMTSDNVITPVNDTVTAADGEGKIKITFNGDSGVSGNPIDKGVYVYKITAKDISRVVTVTVAEPSSTTEVSYYRLSLGTTSKDLKVESWTSLPQYVSIDLFGYAANGVKMTKVNLTNTGDAFKVEVDAPADNDNPAGQKFEDTGANGLTTASGYEVVKLDTTTLATGSIIRKAPIGTYKVTAYNGSVVVDTAYFSTVDTQTAAVLSDIKSQTYAADVTSFASDSASLLAAVKGDDNNGLKFKVGGTNAEVVAVDAVGTADSIAVKSVTVRYKLKGEGTTAVYLDYKVNVGLNMKKR